MIDNAGNDPIPLLEVMASSDQVRVQMARDLLESGGIDAFIFDRESSRMYGGAAIHARLMVYADEAAEARARLKELGFID